MNIKVIYGKMLVTMSHVFGVDFAKKFDTRLRFHRTLNLKNPTSLADKVTYVELHKQSSLAPCVLISMRFVTTSVRKDWKIF